MAGGFWGIYNQTLDPGLGRPVVDLIVCAVVLFFTCRLLMKQRHTWWEFRTISRGLVFLILWYLLESADLIVRHVQLSLAYGYILSNCFWTVPKVVSDVIIFTGVVQIVSHQLRITPTQRRRWDVAGAWMILIQWFWGIYYLCLVFALAFVWLSAADVSVIQTVAIGRNDVEIAFNVCQFVFVAMAFILIMDARPRVPQREAVEPHLLAACTKQWGSLKWAVLALLVRSFCEMVICLAHHETKDRGDFGAARTGLYGPFTVVFVVLIDDAASYCSGEIDEVDLAVKEIKGRARARIFERLSHLTQGSTVPPPVFREVLQAVRKTNPAELWFRGLADRPEEEDMVRQILEVYVDELDRRYGSLEARVMTTSKRT